MVACDRNVHYINRQGQEQYMTMREYPVELEKKMKLLTYFRRYMTEHLMKAGKLHFISDLCYFVCPLPTFPLRSFIILWVLQLYLFL